MVKSITKKSEKSSKIHQKKSEDKKMPKPKVEVNISKKVEVAKKQQSPSPKSNPIPIKIISKDKSVKSKTSSVKHPLEKQEIHSLKQLEDKILEKFEEKKPEIMELMNVEENKLDVPVDMPTIELVETLGRKKVHSKKIERSAETKTEKIEIQEHQDEVDAYNDLVAGHKKEIKEKNDDDKDYKARVEAILFAVGKYLDDEIISQLCDIDKRNTKKALEELKKEYDAHDGALVVIQEGNSWKINVREKYLSLVRKIVSDTELSKSIMETLAVIAWKTPIYQNEVVRIRGNKCYDHIAELENAGFVTKDKKGRSYVLKTTDKFYNYFDIDQKNLHGVMSEAKLPNQQKTLDETDKPEEKPYSRENLLQALETIETKSIVQTEEDKLAQKQFLEQIHHKIDAASKRTDEVVADMPRPMHELEEEKEQTQSDIPSEDTSETSETPAPLRGNAVVEKDEDIVINTDIPNGSEHHFQKPEEQPQKPKQLTKKQLEKKFKDELQRVKEKSENKK
jgi:segregation and condensation protein B